MNDIEFILMHFTVGIKSMMNWWFNFLDLIFWQLPPPFLLWTLHIRWDSTRCSSGILHNWPIPTAHKILQQNCNKLRFHFPITDCCSQYFHYITLFCNVLLKAAMLQYSQMEDFSPKVLSNSTLQGKDCLLWLRWVNKITRARTWNF